MERRCVLTFLCRLAPPFPSPLPPFPRPDMVVVVVSGGGGVGGEVGVEVKVVVDGQPGMGASSSTLGLARSPRLRDTVTDLLDTKS